MKQLKLLFVTPSFYPATYWGGPIQSLKELCDSLATTRTVELRVLTTDTNGRARANRVRPLEHCTKFQKGYTVYYCKRNYSVSFSAQLATFLPSMIGWADVVHLTAVYSFPTIPTLAICKLLKKPVVWSPRGALQRWDNNSRRALKAIWDNVCNRLCDDWRVTLHFTSEKERDESYGRMPHAAHLVIPNGVRIRNFDEGSKGEVTGLEPVNGALRLLYLGRLHPIKGIENLIQSMRFLHPSITLSICGDGDFHYEGRLKGVVQDLNLKERVFFRGYITEDEKLQQFANSDIFVIPSFSESFGLSAVEAMSCGLPVIASKGTPWKEIEARGCGLWVENNPETLAEAVRRISKMPLKDMGIAGRKWMASDFSWDAISKSMFEVYTQLLAKRNSNGQSHNF